MNSKLPIILILLAASVTAWFSKDFARQWFNSSNIETNVKSIKLFEIDNNVAKEKLESNSQNPKVNLEVTEGKDTLEQYAVNRSQDVNGQLDDTKAKSILHINEYRRYLSNMNQLLINFLQNKIYSNQITYARLIELPPSIDAILELFEQYNVDYLINRGPDYKKVFPKDCNITQKFIKITKKTNSGVDKELLRNKIINNLDLLQDYIYSEEIQKIFIGYKE